MTTADESGSPFASLIAASPSDLPFAFRTQFLIGPRSDEIAIVSGQLDRVWHRPFFLWPVFWLLGHVGLLFPDAGSNIPAILRISGGHHHGRPCQFWKRRFQFARQRSLDAIVVYDNQRRRLIELLGPGGAFEIHWRTRFEGAPLRVIVRSWALRLGPVRLPLPSIIVGTLRIQQIALTGDSVHLRFVHSLPVLGDVFGYEGTLNVRREVKA